MTKEEAKKILACRGNGYSEEDFNNAIEVAFNCIPPLPSNLDEAEFEYTQSLDGIPANQEEEKMIYDAFKAGAEWRDAQIPKLPNSIDEAAEKYAIQGHENHTNVNYINTYIEGKRIGFIAGAEWMAGQGYTKEGIARPDDCEIWVNLTGTDIKDGDKVIVQVRKKGA